MTDDSIGPSPSSQQEAETKERLSYLFSLILTTSKTTQNLTTNETEAVPDPELALNGNIGDVLKECEQHLSESIYHHQDEIKGKDQDIHQIEDRLAQCQKSLEEKSTMIEELQLSIQDYHGINEDLQSQLDKYRNSFAEVNKRWDGLESSINDYKECLVISEGKATMLEAQKKANDHIRNQLEEQLDRENEYCDQQHLMDLKNQLHRTKLETEQQRKTYMMELDKEREQSRICRTKICQVQTKLDEVETALKRAKIDEVEYALNLAKLNQAKDATRKSNTTSTPQLSATTLPPITSSESESASPVTNSIRPIIRYMYLDHGAGALLLIFALWLFM
ncbi:unnamed protein product [Absidia cylindrospora]